MGYYSAEHGQVSQIRPSCAGTPLLQHELCSNTNADRAKAVGFGPMVQSYNKQNYTAAKAVAPLTPYEMFKLKCFYEHRSVVRCKALPLL